MNPDAVAPEPYQVRSASKVPRLNGKFVSKPKPLAFVPPVSKVGQDDTLAYRRARPRARRLDDDDGPGW
jgi:hypothetical protein